MMESFEVEVLSLVFVGVEARNQSSCDNPERRNLIGCAVGAVENKRFIADCDFRHRQTSGDHFQ
jgi:hypothetical protein